MRRIFITYRREDSAGETRGIYDRLAKRFGADQVFRDIEAIEPGVDFVEQIEREIETCGAVLVIIGRWWLSVTDERGQPRLADPDDFVRIEVSSALRKTGARVIPVLVNGAKMPGSDELPEPLAPLARRNGVEVTDSRFEYDTARLIRVLERALDISEPEAPDQEEPAPRPRPPQPPEQASGRQRLDLPLVEAYERCRAGAAAALDDARVEDADEANRRIVLRTRPSLTGAGERVTLRLTSDDADATTVEVVSTAVGTPAPIAGVLDVANRVSGGPAPRQRNRENVERMLAWLVRPPPEAGPARGGGARADWYPDPGHPGMLRWWDGSQWTEHRVQPAANAAAAPGRAAAGWYPDPGDPSHVRYWDGATWTSRTARRG
jgi:TIR domain/Protein of unknown function (DUF2510)